LGVSSKSIDAGMGDLTLDAFRKAQFPNSHGYFPLPAERDMLRKRRMAIVFVYAWALAFAA
jgi:hypothetical protein